MTTLQKDAAAGAIEVVAVHTAADRREFVKAAAPAYADDPLYITPLEFEVAQRINPAANPTLKDAPHQLWMAAKNGAPAGRIAAMVNPLHLARHKDDAAHFGFIEAVDDPAVFAALFGAAESWARARGMKKLAGPFNFSVNEECGLLVDGFDTPPYVMMPHGRPYYKTRVEELGYGKAMDMFALSYVNELQFLPERRQRFIDKMLANPKVAIRNLDMKNFTADVRLIVDIFNDAWADNWGFVPFTDEQAEHMAKELRPIIAPYNVVICYYDGEAAAFCLVLPNINEAIRDFGGKLLPFNWAKLLWRLKVKGLSTARMPLMGIRKKLQGKPVGLSFAYKMIQLANTENMRRGLTSSEVGWILESNEAMMSVLIDMGCKVYKTYRIYEKAL